MLRKVPCVLCITHTPFVLARPGWLLTTDHVACCCRSRQLHMTIDFRHLTRPDIASPDTMSTTSGFEAVPQTHLCILKCLRMVFCLCMRVLQPPGKVCEIAWYVHCKTESIAVYHPVATIASVGCRCTAEKGDDNAECKVHQKAYRSICPSEWVSQTFMAPALSNAVHILWFSRRQADVQVTTNSDFSVESCSVKS